MPNTPYPLGRIEHHDPANIRYALPVLPRTAIRSVDWRRRVPIFDQGSLGSCTGNAAIGCLGTDSLVRSGLTQATITQIVSLTGAGLSGPYTATKTVPVDEDLAVMTYSIATGLDPFEGHYPPDDTGSDGGSACLAMVRLGLSSRYEHAFSLDAVKAALMSGPLLWGTVWYWSMFDPTADGNLVIDPSSGEAGGHELAITGYDLTTDVYKVANSWGSGWGDQGYCYLKGSDLGYLLSRGGDATQPTWVVAAPPPTDQQVHNAYKTYKKIEEAWAKGKGLT